MKSYKKHLAHQNTSNSLAKKTLMKHASAGRMMSRKDKTTMKAATIKSQEEKVKIAETIADEMIDVACTYANKWGRTSGVGFVVMYGKNQGFTILDENGLRSFFEQQRNNLVDCIEHGGRATTGVLNGKSFKLNRGNIDATIRKIFLGYIYRLGIAVDTSGKKNVLEGIFSRLIRSDIKNFKSEEKGKGGISSYIEAIARFSDKKLNPYYWQNIEGWKILFKKLDKVAGSIELENEEFSKHSDGKEENADADIFVSASKYTPPETEMKREIEKIAVEIASSYYRENGYTVTSVEHENCGWDLTVFRASDCKELHIEVKGTSRNEFHFFLSKNEYDKMMNDPKWRLFVAKNVLEDPDPECIVKRRQNVEKLFDLIPFCIEGIWKDE